MTDAARLFASVSTRLGEAWNRIVVYGGLEPPERSLRWVAADTWDEVHHDALDVQRQLA